MKMTGEELLKKQMEAQIEWLREASPEKIVEGAYSIFRVQDLLSSGWETIYYILVLATGGPHIELQTDGKLKGWWWADKLEWYLDDEMKEKLVEVEAILDELFE